jgi:hypothetical protein
MEIDAIDNGVNVSEKVNYSIKTGLSSRVSKLNPSWNTPDDEIDLSKGFEKAMELGNISLIY